MRALIIDDEKSARETMAAMLARYCPSVKNVGEAATVDEGLTLISTVQPDLLLLDIRIGTSTGFDLLTQVTNCHFNVIFTTAYDHFALKAIKFSATDYLLKPIDPDELVAAIQKVDNSLLSARQEMKVLIEHMANTTSQQKNIVLPITGGFQMVQIANIENIEADQNYSIVHLVDQSRIVASKSLKEFDDLLSGLQFLRIHQSHLINLTHIQAFKSAGRAGMVEMKSGTKLDVARSKKLEVIQFFKSQRI